MGTEKVVQNASEVSRGVFLDTILPGIITLVLSGIVIYIIRAFMIKSLRRSDKMEERQKVRLVKTVTTALAILAIIIVVSGYGLQTGSLLALIGVAGLSLSLAVQGVMSNFFSGCVLPITKPFREGDIIDVGGTVGKIERIGYFNTTIVTLEKLTVIIPNSALTSCTIANYSTMETLNAEKTFCVAPSMADEDVRAALREAIGKDPRILTDPEPAIRIDSFDSMGTSYTVTVPCKSKDYDDVCYALVENVYFSFKAHSIEMGCDMGGMRGGGMGGGRGKGGQQSGGSGGGMGMGGQQSGGSGGGRGGSGRQSGGAGGGSGSGRGMGGQQSVSTGSQGGSGQQSVSTGSQSESGQQSGGKGSGSGNGRGGSGQQSGGKGGRGGSGQKPD